MLFPGLLVWIKRGGAALPIIIMRTTLLFFTLILWAVCLFYVVGSINDEEEEPHPDPNEEDYSNMIYIGRMDDEGKRVGFEHDNGMYIVSCLCCG